MMEFSKKRAFLIGVNKYENVSHLEFCREDALDLAAVLRDSLGFADEDILTFVEDTDLPPEKAKIFHYLGKINEAANVSEDDLIVFFFSGHGMIGKDDGKDYLLPIEATPYNLDQSAIKIEAIAKELKRTGCKNIVMFIDACREPIAGTKGVVSIGEESAESLKRAGIVTFFSCNPKDKSYEIESLKHGSFTYCILDAIANGEAGTVSALESYLRRQVPVINEKYKKPAQQPYAVIEPAEKGDLPIFFTAVQAVKAIASIKEWLASIGEMFDEDRLQLDLFNKIVLYLTDDPRDASFEQDRRTLLIKQLCSGALASAAFGVAWEAHERRKIAATKTSLGRLN
jgi:uncharacterized caspase-like protein